MQNTKHLFRYYCQLYHWFFCIYKPDSFAILQKKGVVFLFCHLFTFILLCFLLVLGPQHTHILYKYFVTVCTTFSCRGLHSSPLKIQTSSYYHVIRGWGIYEDSLACISGQTCSWAIHACFIHTVFELWPCPLQIFLKNDLVCRGQRVGLSAQNMGLVFKLASFLSSQEGRNYTAWWLRSYPPTFYSPSFTWDQTCFLLWLFQTYLQFSLTPIYSDKFLDNLCSTVTSFLQDFN